MDYTPETTRYKIIGCAYNVYNELGPGLLESVYEDAMMWELQLAGFKAERQVELPILYKGLKLGNPLRLDIVVEDEVLIELKSVDHLEPVHFKQVSTYLKLSRYPKALLINFNTNDLRKNIHRLP